MRSQIKTWGGLDQRWKVKRCFSTLEAEKIKWSHHNRDRILKTFTKNLRIGLIRNTRCVQIAQDKHELHSQPIATQLLGKTMAGVSLMASFLRGEERIKVSFEGSGLIQDIVVEAIQVGEVRGFINQIPDVEASEKAPVELGFGICKVSKILCENAKPVLSVVAIQKGDIVSEFQQFFDISEQIPTVIALETDLQHNGQVSFSGGILIQAMPFAPSNLISDIRETVSKLAPLSNLVEGKTLLELFPFILPKKELDSLPPEKEMEHSPIDFFCRHSRSRLFQALLQLKPQELDELGIDANSFYCQHCNEKFVLTQEELSQLQKKSQE